MKAVSNILVPSSPVEDIIDHLIELAKRDKEWSDSITRISSDNGLQYKYESTTTDYSDSSSDIKPSRKKRKSWKQEELGTNDTDDENVDVNNVN